MVEVKSPLRYAGGKQRSAEFIFSHFPKKSASMREVFCGGASLTLKAISKGFAEQNEICDAFWELTNFWRIAKDPVMNPLMCKRLRELLEAKDKKFFFKGYQNNFDGFGFCSHLQMAVQFFFLNRCSFSGTILAGGFSESASKDRFTESSIERLAQVPKVLSEVKLFHEDFTQSIKRPGKDVFLFLDPPYTNAKKLYGPEGKLQKINHQLLANTLREGPYPFLMTYDDSPIVRDLYSWATIIPWELSYSMSKNKQGKELLIKYGY